MNNTEKLVLQQHFVPYPAGRMVTARPLPGLRRYAGSADGRLCLAHDHFRVFAYSAVRHTGNNGRDNGHRVCKDDDHGRRVGKEWSPGGQSGNCRAGAAYRRSHSAVVVLGSITRTLPCVETRLAIIQRTNVIMFERIAGRAFPHSWIIHDDEEAILSGG